MNTVTISMYHPEIGSVLQGLLNGLKHIPETIGPIIGISSEKLKGIILGIIPFDSETEQALLRVTGINQRDFYLPEYASYFPIIDDTDNGVRIMRKSETEKSQRILSRGPEKIPYYIYADTAMSNTSTFRPEWIKELFVHDGDSADDLPEWAFNKGHFEHQVTYFIGPVNFYWIDRNGKRHMRKMNTGDTNYIVPFVPHTFATREKDQGLILAVTYGGAIANPDFRALIAGKSPEEYLKWVREKLQKVPFERDSGTEDGVSILCYRDALWKNNWWTLIKCFHQQNTRVREILLRPGECFSEPATSDRWMYHLGDQPIKFGQAGGHKEISSLFPGDSMFMRSGAGGTFFSKEKAEMLVIDINPGAGDPYQELKVIERYAGEEGLKRAHTETTRWY